jgi:RNA polymerase II subunit A small phosphatase-like protein
MANSPTQMNDDDDGGCCCGLFGKKRAQSHPPQRQDPENNNTNNNTNNNGNNDSPVVNKLQIPSIVTQVDRDQVGVNSPRPVEIKPHMRPKQANKISLLPPQKPGREGRKCLVLDLDETLVHSSFQPVDRYDFLIPVEIDGNVYQVCALRLKFFLLLHNFIRYMSQRDLMLMNF